MNKVFLFALLLISQRAFCECKECSNVTSRAIMNILTTYFASNSAKVDIIYQGAKFGQCAMLVDELLKSVPDSISIKVTKSGSENPWSNRLNVSSLILFDSPQVFKDFSKNIEWISNKRMRFKHLVYSPNLRDRDIVENIKNGLDIDQVGFLMNETETSIDLVTSFMFTPDKCRQNQLVMINRFDINTMTWESSNFYPSKYQTFHKCPLTIGIHDETEKGYRYHLAYPTMKVYIELSKFFNFKIDFKFVNLKKFLKAHMNNEFDFFFMDGSFDGDNDFITSVPFIVERGALTVPAGESYSALEKMFMPFQFEVWIAIVATLLTGFITIWIINLLSIKIRAFVYGLNIRTPTLNLMSIFLNGAQHRLPGRNFARFLLMMFIIWSLIIRTCYQSELFKYLQTDSRKPRIKSFDEMIEKNFTWYTINPAFEVNLQKHLKNK